MSKNSTELTVNPAPLGLAGFGMTTILLNIHNAGFFEVNAMILMMGIFYGGLAQLIAGIMEFKKDNTFGFVAFTSYGCFWMTLVGIFILEEVGFMAADSFSMGCYLFMWGLLTLGLFFGTLKGGKVGQAVFFSLTVLFFLLALAKFTGSHLIHTIAGYEGIICGGIAFYEAIAIVINDKHGKQVLPL
ncbi:acetate uptake transporter [Aureibacter tunicatorum]|uniref:Uncharacterized protein n=1 Tax=Aureibacter tunicatorum TaxID=866807 RepID=A0AAE3XL62_9BACT|nr:acetate uptake transporter [Aureibacter tunicatorum]MDR6239901.1 hypothetical protein [Aureibacter tunicatorum]BDD04376.1 hypothetical protein AUTU_18590 [Aureibacter tunicatorum]